MVRHISREKTLFPLLWERVNRDVADVMAPRLKLHSCWSWGQVLRTLFASELLEKLHRTLELSTTGRVWLISDFVDVMPNLNVCFEQNKKLLLIIVFYFISFCLLSHFLTCQFVDHCSIRQFELWHVTMETYYKKVSILY